MNTNRKKVEKFADQHILCTDPIVYQWNDTAYSVLSICEPAAHPDFETNDIYDIAIIKGVPMITGYNFICSSDIEKWVGDMKRRYSPRRNADKADIDLPF